ncbi:MAG TPA: hypothetical protein VI997_08215 [Candidatus Thermoplasmatota archaeon]|nr:hypothetical protein [Candidatus Thermoplasmatota archaeon]
MHESMERRLGNQRSLEIRDIRGKKRASLVAMFLILPAMLLAAGLLVHFAWQSAAGGSRIPVAVAIGVGGAFAAWGFIAAFPHPYGK